MRMKTVIWTIGAFISAPISARPSIWNRAAKPTNSAPRATVNAASGSAKLTSRVNPSGFDICIAAIAPAPSALIKPTRAARRHRPGSGCNSAHNSRHLTAISSAGDQASCSARFSRARAHVNSIAGLCMLLALAAAVAGCAVSSDRPELNPARFAPPEQQHEWMPRAGGPSIDLEGTDGEVHERGAPANGTRYSLSALIELALGRNPETRAAWQAARAEAAGWAVSRAPFYPTVRVDSENGYERIIDQVPKHWGTLKNWRSSNQLMLNYDLIDFGRRDAASRSRATTASRRKSAFQSRDTDRRLRGREKLLPARRAACRRYRGARDRASRDHGPQVSREASCGWAGDQT